MKILIIYQYFGTPKGGWSTRMYEMPLRWVKAGHEVTIVSAVYDKSDLKIGKGLVTDEYFEGIRVKKVNTVISNKHSKLKRVLHFTWFAALSTWISLISKYDVLIASSGPITVGIPGLVGKLRRKRFVFEVRDLWPQGAIELGVVRNRYLISFLFWFENLLYQKSDLIIACSNGMSADITNRYPSLRDKMRVIPNGSDLELFKSNGSVVKDLNTYVYTGSIGLMDDCMQIVDAARELQNRKRDDVRITIVGDGSELQELRKGSKGLKNITFVGLITKTEVREYLFSAVASIITFKPVRVLDTSSPNKLFDSLAAGIPGIQTTNGWIKDLVSENKIGINIKPNSPSQMADAMERLIDEGIIRDDMAKNARKTAEKYFDRNILSRQYLTELTNLVE